VTERIFAVLCQLLALNDSFYICICSFSTKFILQIILSHKPIYGFVKTNGHYIEILLSVSILTRQSSSASHFASARPILCESDQRRRSYDVVKILKMAAVNWCREWTSGSNLVVRMSSEGQGL